MAGSLLTWRVRPESGARTDSWACEVVIRASGQAVEQGAAKGLGSSPGPTGQIGAEAVILEVEGNRAPSHASWGHLLAVQCWSPHLTRPRAAGRDCGCPLGMVGGAACRTNDALSLPAPLCPVCVCVCVPPCCAPSSARLPLPRHVDSFTAPPSPGAAPAPAGRPPPAPSLMDESWFVTPPACFTAEGPGLGPARLQSSPLEDLLIEHPSMSVYVTGSTIVLEPGPPSPHPDAALPDGDLSDG